MRLLARVMLRRNLTLAIKNSTLVAISAILRGGWQMDKAWLGFFLLLAIFHLVLIVIPVVYTLRAQISLKSRLLWCAFLFFVPFIGAFLFHFKYRSSLFVGRGYQRSAAEERASSGTLSPDDRD